MVPPDLLKIQSLCGSNKPSRLSPAYVAPTKICNLSFKCPVWTSRYISVQFAAPECYSHVFFCRAPTTPGSLRVTTQGTSLNHHFKMDYNGYSLICQRFIALKNLDTGTVLVSCDTGTVLMSHTHVTGHKNRPHVRVTTLNDNLEFKVHK